MGIRKSLKNTVVEQWPKIMKSYSTGWLKSFESDTYNQIEESKCTDGF